MCCVQYQVCADQTKAFSLSSGDNIATAAILDSLCTNDYTEIIGKKLILKIFHLIFITSFWRVFDDPDLCDFIQDLLLQNALV